ncbi:MAG: polyketide synthase dehydratase domain-containing protein [Bauldia sp.]|nr:polyketide synthase dehydratase domain-containing protein [Bauldia sp.]
MISYSQKVKALKAKAPAVPVQATPAPVDCQEKVLVLLAAVLGVPRESVQAATPFAEMGLSSLLGVRFLDSVNRAFGLRLGVETLFAHSSAAALAAHVASLAPLPVAASAAPVLRAVEPAPVAEVNAGDIAIIGMAGRFPGASNVEAFWQALAEGRCLVREVPPERWSAADFYDPGADAAAKGKSISKWAGFLDDIDRFDAAFFNISPREAAAMDPQQRLFLEQAWLAFENAGYPAEKLRGSRTGVYVGASGSGYETMLDPAAKSTQAYGLTGNLVSLLASRIAYFLDLRGPSLVVDTACSASLVALDLACQALQRGEIGMALVGGVCLFLDEKPFVAMTRTGMLSPDGRCHTFDAAANGIAVGEAAAAVVLKPLARALADGDRIDAVIKATGTNQDGRSNGITAPNPEAQTALVRAVHARAGINPASITYIEAHGTGTPLGDPVEVAALRDALGVRPSGDVPCALGAVKSNIGHTAEAAGVAGLIKTVLCLQHRELVPSVNFDTLNPAIALGDSGLQVVTQRQPWQPARDGKRRAGLSSFGLSGTNAHVVLEEAPAVAALAPASGPQLLLLSARDDAGLQRMREALAAWLLGPGADANLADVAATLALGRTHFDCRAAFVATTVGEAAELLGARLSRAARGMGEAEERAALESRAPSDELHALSKAYLAGAAPDPALWAGGRRNLPLPGYPFAGAVHWAARRPEAVPVSHPFADGDGAVARRFTADDPVVRDHVIGGVPVLHASIFLEMARLAASRQRPGETVRGLRDVAWEQTVRVAREGAAVRIDTAPAADGLACTMAFDGGTAARGRAMFGPAGKVSRIDIDIVKRSADQHVTRAALDALDRGAVRLGPSFAGFDELWLAPDAALSWIGPSASDQGFVLSPRLMDAAIQTGAALLARNDGPSLRLRFPAGIAAIDIVRRYQPGQPDRATGWTRLPMSISRWPMSRANHGWSGRASRCARPLRHRRRSRRRHGPAGSTGRPPLSSASPWWRRMPWSATPPWRRCWRATARRSRGRPPTIRPPSTRWLPGWAPAPASSSPTRTRRRHSACCDWSSGLPRAASARARWSCASSRSTPPAPARPGRRSRVSPRRSAASSQRGGSSWSMSKATCRPPPCAVPSSQVRPRPTASPSCGAAASRSRACSRPSAPVGTRAFGTAASISSSAAWGGSGARWRGIWRGSSRPGWC